MGFVWDCFLFVFVCGGGGDCCYVLLVCFACLCFVCVVFILFCFCLGFFFGGRVGVVVGEGGN